MKHKEYLLIPTLILAAAASAGCGAEKKAEGSTIQLASTPALKPPVAVNVYAAAASTSPDLQLIPAVIAGNNTAIVLAQRDGVVRQMKARAGDRVNEGQELARLSQDDLQAQLRQARLEVERLKIEEQQYESQMRVSRAELAQEEALLKDGLTSRQMFDRTQSRAESAVHELEKARLATRSAEAKVESGMIELEKTVIRAPIGGLVTQAYPKLGASIVRNDKAFEITQLLPLQVKFKLPQPALRPLRPGDVVSLSLPGDDRVAAQARVKQMDPITDPASNTIGYSAEVLRRIDWMLGAAVDLRLSTAALRPTIRVPRVAFADRIEPHSAGALLILENAKCLTRAVTVGEVDADQVVITSGLQTGDQVILSPPPGLKSGDPVLVSHPVAVR